MSNWKLVYKDKDSKNKNHHIYKNRTVWYMHITIVNVAGTRSDRRRFSLKTGDVEKARRRRDKIINAIIEQYGMVENARSRNR